MRDALTAAAAASVVVAGALAAGGCGDRAPATSEPSSIATVSGVVTLGPQCPVEIAGQPCPTTPPDGVVITVAERLPGEAYAAGPAVATATTDVEGRFEVDVPPGEYAVTADAGMSCEIVDVVATTGRAVETLVPCDTGIR